MNDIELNRRELTGNDALRFARESGMERESESRGLFLCGVGDLIRFARLVRDGWNPAASPSFKSTKEALDHPPQDAESFVRMLLWDDFPECCGCPVADTGGEYMGQTETVMSCCGNPEPALLSDAQIVASLRERFTSPYRPPGCGVLPDGGYECVCGQCAVAEPREAAK